MPKTKKKHFDSSKRNRNETKDQRSDQSKEKKQIYEGMSNRIESGQEAALERSRSMKTMEILLIFFFSNNVIDHVFVGVFLAVPIEIENDSCCFTDISPLLKRLCFSFQFNSFDEKQKKKKKRNDLAVLSFCSFTVSSILTFILNINIKRFVQRSLEHDDLIQSIKIELKSMMNNVSLLRFISMKN